MVDPNDVVVYNGEPVKIKDLTQTNRAFFGYGHFPRDIADRKVHQSIGIEDPEHCTRADETMGVWINYGSNLVCPGCGLDFT